MTERIVTPADNGSTISAHRGDEIVLRLPENPTTGYRWHLDGAGNCLDAQDVSYRSNAPERMGSGGTRELRFRAAAAGRTRIELRLWREWEGEDSVTERFAVDVEIAE